MSVPYRRPGPQGALGESARSISDLSKGERLLPEGTVGSDQPHPPATAGQAVWESLDYTAVDSGLQQRVLREQDPKLKHGKKAEIEVLPLQPLNWEVLRWVCVQLRVCVCVCVCVAVSHCHRVEPRHL